MRIALTANGPGEVAGWMRPLLRALYARVPNLEAFVFLVPDDYASGNEAATARALFPQARVYEPQRFLRIAFGRDREDIPTSVDVVQYLGGDLGHAARLRKRLGGIASTYKFSRPKYRELFARAFAVDQRNAQQLTAWQTPPDRVSIVGNLAIDGAALEAQQPLEAGTPEDGILIMPGSRSYEVENLVPLFFTAAMRMLREVPGLPIAFGISPFTKIEAVRGAIERGGHPRVWSKSGHLVEEGERLYLTDADGRIRVPVLRNALAAATRARLALTLPGTKTIELASLGVPMVTISPFNVPEEVTINGPLTYLDRIPLIGAPLKRAVVVAVANRFPLMAQPNMDLGEMVIAELHGTLTPGRVARVTLERYNDAAWLGESAARLRALYRDHVGAAGRMAESLVELATAAA
jgi:hypothetical protein